MGDDGAESLAKVLAHCQALAHLELWSKKIGDAGRESLKGVLVQ